MRMAAAKVRAVIRRLWNETGGDDVPTYEYKYEKCGEFEKDQRITDPERKKCPHCGGKAQRQVGGGGGFICNGGNWVSKMASSGDSPKKITDRMMKQAVGEVAEDIARGSKERERYH
jgi:putative FmdB family regulatory protein